MSFVTGDLLLKIVDFNIFLQIILKKVDLYFFSTSLTRI